MTIVKQVEEGVFRVFVVDQPRLVDDETLQQVYKDMAEEIQNAAEKHLVIDFGLVQFMSSAGLGTLVRFKRRCDEQGKSLHLCNFVPVVAETVRITGLDKVLDIHDDLAQAIAAIGEAD
jgi:anti-anti-sigma factor